MSRAIPSTIRAAVGLVATVIDDVRALPGTLPGLPVRIIGLAMQATMRLQQQYSGLVARGDEVFTGLRGEAEPGLATFDEDLPEPTAGRTSAFDRAPGFDRPTPFDRASVPEDDEAIAEEVAALIDDELSGLPADPAPEEVVEALADINDEVAAAGLDLDRAEPGLSAEDALESALLEADGTLVDGGAGDAGAVDTDEIAESPADAPASLLEAEATEFDVHSSAAKGSPAPSDPGGSPVGEAAGVPDVGTDVDVLTPDGGVATVEGTVTDEGVAAPEAPAGEGAGAAADDDRDATGSEVVTAAGAAVDEALGAGEPTGGAPAAAGTGVATDEGGTVVAAATDDRDATGRGDEVVTAAGAAVDDALGAGGDTAGSSQAAGAAGSAPVEGYDTFTLAQLRGRLRGYQLPTVQALLAHEEATRAREPYLRMLRNRLEKLERQAAGDSPLAPRGLG